jgi:hypothetical protein
MSDVGIRYPVAEAEAVRQGPATSTAAERSVLQRVVLTAAVLFGLLTGVFLYVILPGSAEAGVLAAPVSVVYALYLGAVVAVYLAATVCLNPDAVGR